MKRLSKYSMGIGDRFGRQGAAQLDALLLARHHGIDVTPVWNKSHREHTIVGTRPADVRAEADRAVKTRGWTTPYFVDADHVNLKTVDAFLESCDFFTLDVADCIGEDPGGETIDQFVDRRAGLIGRLSLPGIDRPLEISGATLVAAARTFGRAIAEAGRIWRRIEQAKSELPVIEVSLDETARPQTPTYLLLILAMIAEEGIPAQTIAPRFVGQFNKGVDYVGDVAELTRQFADDLAVLAFAVHEFGLPNSLKLSVHSGSDKVAIYGPIRRALQTFNAGVHLKTAGTTWLEELIGLALAADDGLQIAKDIYDAAWRRSEELMAPYAAVLDIDQSMLPPPEDVAHWDGETFAAALRHDAVCSTYNPSLRQLLHVAYKIAAEMGGRFTDALDRHAETIAARVSENLYQRHIRPLFLGVDK